MRILIVEDDAVIAMLPTDSLEDGGHEVVGPAATMAEALALCEAPPPPDLAVLDIDLRDGSSGVDVARALRDGSSGVDVARALLERWGVLSIFASGQTMEARQARDIALGYIRKPYEAATVLGQRGGGARGDGRQDTRARARGPQTVLRGRLDPCRADRCRGDKGLAFAEPARRARPGTCIRRRRPAQSRNVRRAELRSGDQR